VNVEEAVRQHAAKVSVSQLRRARRRLGVLAPRDQRAVEELAASVAERVAACLLETAAADPVIAAALRDASIGRS
jgi:hypothetical protein